MAFQGNPLLKYSKAFTRIQLLVLRLLNIIKDLPTKEISELTKKFKDFKIAQIAILNRQVEL